MPSKAEVSFPSTTLEAPLVQRAHKKLPKRKRTFSVKTPLYNATFSGKSGPKKNLHNLYTASQ